MGLLSSTLYVQYCFIVNITYVLSFLFRNFSSTKRPVISFTYLSRTRDVKSTNYEYYVFILFSFIYIYIFFISRILIRTFQREEKNSKKSKSLSRGSIRTDLIFNQFSALISDERNVCPSFRRSRKNFVSSSTRRQSDRKK